MTNTLNNDFYIGHLKYACDLCQTLPTELMYGFYEYICETFTFDSDMMEYGESIK